MSLGTVIRASLIRPINPSRALVLMGGGARTAYQVGVLQALSSMLTQSQGSRQFPFKVLVGTSAGALNVAYLAGCATSGMQAFEQLTQFWGGLRSHQVYTLKVSRWSRANKLVAALSLWRRARVNGAILDNTPLVETLRHAVSLTGIDEALRHKIISTVAVTASSYTSGEHWTFCHALDDRAAKGWSRPGRHAEFGPLTIDHLIASSAIPFLFPSTGLWVGGRREFFGDGSMRQISPLSPALHLGAQKILVVGVGQPQRSGFVAGQDDAQSNTPTLGSIAGHAMASVFHDTLYADVEQAQRVTRTLEQLPREVAAALPFRSVEVLAIQPSESLDALAQIHGRDLPESLRDALNGLGAMSGGGALASYLLFEPGFVQALIALGQRDAHERKAELLAFFAGS